MAAEISAVISLCACGPQTTLREAPVRPSSLSIVRSATLILRDSQRVATITHFAPSSLRCPCLLLSDVPEFRYFLFFFPHFLWAHRSGNSSPLRPTRLLLCRFRPQQHWVPSNKADASLRLHAPSLSVVPQRKRGRKKR